MPSKWQLAGTYFESCNCDVACPCVFTSDPTDGDCKVLLAWHIEKGKYGDVSLDGLNAAMAAYSPENMLKGKWDAAYYIDQRASEAQRDALSKIFTGKVGGAMAGFGPLITKVLGTKTVPIQYQVKGKERSMSIPSVGEMEIAAIEGHEGKLVTLHNAPLNFQEPVVVAKSKTLKFHDHGLNWQFTGKNGFYSPFNFKGP